VSDCCLTPTQQFFSYIMARTSYFSMRWWSGSLCTRPTCLVGFFIVLAHWNNSPEREMVPHSGTHYPQIPSQPVFALSPKSYMFSGEATNTNFIVFGLTRPGLEPMIYHTRGEHANHYTTNAVSAIIWTEFAMGTTVSKTW
jgi:hypothetical protein